MIRKLMIAIALMSACTCCFAKTERQLLREISSKMSDSLHTMQSWSAANQRQTEELRQQAEKAMQMARKDHETPNKGTWNKIDRLNENTLGVLHASSELWHSFGSFSKYLLSFKKAEEWQECFQANMTGGPRCSFRAIMSRLNSNSIDYVKKAMYSAEQHTQAIDESIRKLEDMSFEARNSDGLGAGLDTLAKVNAASAASLADLGSNINTLLSIQAHEAASAHNLSLAEQEGTRAVLEGGGGVDSPHFNMQIGNYDTGYGYFNFN
jgi:hypothetical protein